MNQFRETATPLAGDLLQQSQARDWRRRSALPSSMSATWQRQVAVLLFILTAGIACSSGCVRRSMLIRTQPAGAVVYVDQQEYGMSPVRVPFTYYGAHRIRVEKDGFETVEVDQRVDAPWYQIPPLDFFYENLWFKEIRDDRVVDFQLEPQKQVREFELRERAEQLRANVQSGMVVPLREEASYPPPSQFGNQGLTTFGR